MFDQLAVCPKLVIVGGKVWRDRWKVHPPFVPTLSFQS